MGAPVPRQKVTAAIALAMIASAVCAFLVMLTLRGTRWWVFTLDDAFITLRYSAHWAHGLGPSWNPGAEPAEGYTTTLWMALLALAIRLGLDGLLFAKLAGAGFAVGALALASHMAYRFSSRRALAACTPWLLACAYWPFTLHAVSGMETTCSAFILTLFFWLSSEPRWPRALALSALFACLARPEAALPCAVTLAFLLIQQRGPLLRAVALYTVLPGALYFALRTWYFGLLFPLSFYVKATGQAPLAGLEDVVGFFAVFFVSQPWWGALAVLGTLRERALRPAVWGALAFAVFFVFPEHIMAFESRYLVPLFPLLAALAGVGVSALVDWLATRSRFAEPIVAASLTIAAAVPTSSLSNVERWLDYGRGLTRAHVTFGHALHDTGLRDARIAMLDVGAVGYYGDWYTLDTFGLNDAHVALTQRKDIDYVFRKKPDLLVLVSKKPREFQAVFEWEAPLYAESQRLGYRYTCEYEFEPDYLLQVFAQRPDVTRDRVLCRDSLRP
ncbi:MAG TPA: hypothetical protein VI299_18160 [Polyangiales bacterium]